MSSNRVISTFLRLASLVWAKVINSLRAQQPRIKLVAISRDEAAYLPDWIFHHLHCEFDQISIYINNTTDNSAEIKHALKNNTRVEFIDGDHFFKISDSPPQVAVYKHEIVRSRFQGFTHVMFLDIDEFLMNRELNLNIKEFMTTISKPICCFEWVHKLDENVLFGQPFESKLLIRRAPQVKSIISTSVYIEHVTPHNVYSRFLSYSLANDDNVEFSRQNYTRVANCEMRKPVKQLFILHRMNRHQIEYIAAIRRGRPISSNKITSIFKDNRGGIFDPSNSEELQLNAENYKKYMKKHAEFLRAYNLYDAISHGQEHVLKRYKEVLSMIEKAPRNEADVLKKILKNVSLKEVNDAYSKFQRRSNL